MTPFPSHGGPAARLARGPVVLASIVCLTAGSLAQSQTDPHRDVPTPKDHSGGAVVLPGAAKPASEETRDLAVRSAAENLPAVYEAMGDDARAFAQHDMTLSNPFFEGRYPGTRGNKLAADYIESYFRRARLQPVFGAEISAHDGTVVIDPKASYRQTFSQGDQTRVEEASVSFNLGPRGEVELKPDQQFTVLGSSGSGKVTAPIVFVGYGIDEGKDGYTNYPADTDLSGKIAVVMRFEPMDADGKSRWNEGAGWSPMASLDTKIAAAIDHHAAGIIFVNPPGADDPRSTKLITTLESRPFGKGAKVPIVMASTNLVDKLVQAGDPTDGPRRSLRDFRKHFDEHSTGPIDLPSVTATLATTMVSEPIKTDNVAGMLPGRGKLADQFIVIGAHYDHVGYGAVGAQPKNIGQIHPGADDNASGTSGVMVLADKISRAYADLPANADARSIIFVCFSGEESGLIGSHYFVQHPPIELPSIYAMLNMDMIGRLRTTDAGGPQHGLEVQGTESAEGFYDWLAPYFERSGIEIVHGSEVASNSDHASFYTKKRPVLFFFTGLHREYHTPQDTGFTINPLGAGRVIGLVYDIAMGLSGRDEPLKFTPRREKEEDPHAAVALDPNLSKGVGRVRFGIAPASYSDDKPGVEVGDVYDGTSAADAGIKVGDRLMKWNGKEIANVEAWMPLLTKQRPGDVVDVTLVRAGQEMTVKVKLKARDNGGK